LTAPSMKKPVCSIDEPEPKQAPRADRPPAEGFVLIVDGHFKSELTRRRLLKLPVQTGSTAHSPRCSARRPWECAGLEVRTEYVVVELGSCVIVLHAVDHVLLGVRKAAGRQACPPATRQNCAIFIHRSHAADVGAGASEGSA